MSDSGVLFLARDWFEPRSELAFVTRSLAAAASRLRPVTVMAPGAEGERIPDGGFDVVGAGRAEPWLLPSGLPPCPAVIVDVVTPAVSTLLADIRPRMVCFLSSSGTPPASWRPIAAADGRDGAVDVGLHVPINKLAEQHRHHGFGFTGYQLVLLGDVERSLPEPPPEVDELGASFPEDDIVVVGNGRAQAWRAATLRGEIAVTTRIDLHRLLAHALFVVDLAPGRYLARECVEALRFGTPILVPAFAPAAVEHAHAAGGGVFGDVGGTHHRSRPPAPGLRACADLGTGSALRRRALRTPRSLRRTNGCPPGWNCDRVKRSESERVSAGWAFGVALSFRPLRLDRAGARMSSA